MEKLAIDGGTPVRTKSPITEQDVFEEEELQALIQVAKQKKLRQVRELVGSGIRIEVDGGIDSGTSATVVSYGADTLVAGNAIFSKPDRIAAIRAIQATCV